jgi:hypothetical protein
LEEENSSSEGTSWAGLLALVSSAVVASGWLKTAAPKEKGKEGLPFPPQKEELEEELDLVEAFDQTVRNS